MNSQMLPGRGTEAAERAEDRFFDALAAGDVARIEDLLHEDFLIVDVMSGGVADRASFLAALRDRLVAFDRVQLVERAGRRYGDSAVIVGRTEMSGTFGGAPFAAASRYTHVLVRDGDDRWRLVSAQGTHDPRRRADGLVTSRDVLGRPPRGGAALRGGGRRQLCARAGRRRPGGLPSRRAGVELPVPRRCSPSSPRAGCAASRSTCSWCRGPRVLWPFTWVSEAGQSFSTWKHSPS